MSSTVQQLGLEVQGIRDVFELEKSLKALNVQGRNWTKVTQAITEKGELVGVQIEYLDEQMQAQTATLKNLKGQWVSTSKAVALSTKKIVESVDRTFETTMRLREQEAKEVKRILQQQLKEVEANEKKKQALLKRLDAEAQKSNDRLIDAQRKAQDAEANRKIQEAINLEKQKAKILKNLDDRAFRDAENYKAKQAKDHRKFLEDQARDQKKIDKEKSNSLKRATSESEREYKKQIRVIDQYVEALRKATTYKQLMEASSGSKQARNYFSLGQPVSGLPTPQLNARHSGLVAGRQNKASGEFDQRKIDLLRKSSDEALKNILNFQQLGEEGRSAGEKVTLSWQSVVRVLQASILYRGIALLGSAFHQAAVDAIELEIKIGEIQTLSQKAQLTTRQWQTEIRKLSDQFGNPIFDVAKGTYEALSNQVAEGADVFRFMSEAQKLAIITTESMANAVDATTAIINAFGYSSERVSHVSSVLFKTVDLGRVTLGEMANDLGRISSLSDSLGVSLEEQSAAISTLTNQGLKFDATQTLLSNIMQKLIRPSERMTELFKEWGVTSGEAAIRTFTFAGVMNKIAIAARNSNDEMAEIGELFNRIRAVTGFAALDLETFSSHLNEMRSSATDASGALELLQKNAGKKIQIELNKIKNIFTVDIGNQLLSFFTRVNEGTNIWGKSLHFITGTSGGLSRQLIALLDVSKVLLKTWVTYRTIMFGVNTAMAIHTRISKQLETQGLGLIQMFKNANTQMIILKATAQLLAPALIGLATYAFFKAANAAEDFKQKIDDAVDSAVTKLQQLQETNFDKFVGNLTKSIDATNRSFADSVAVFNRFSAAIAIASDAMTGDLKKAFEEVDHAIDRTAKKAFSSLDDALDSIDDHIKDIAAEIRDIELEKLDVGLRDHLRGIDAAVETAPNTARKIGILNAEIANLTAQATAGLASSVTQDDANVARKQFEARDNLIEKLKELYRDDAETRIRESERAAKADERLDGKKLEAQKRYQLALLQLQERQAAGRQIRRSDLFRLQELQKAANAEGGKPPAVSAAEIEKQLKIDIFNIDKNAVALTTARLAEEDKRLTVLKNIKTLNEADVARRRAAFDGLKDTFAAIDSFDKDAGTVVDLEKLITTARSQASDAGLDPVKEFELFRDIEAKRVTLIKKNIAEEIKLQQGKFNTLTKQLVEKSEAVSEKQLELQTKLKQQENKASEETVKVLKRMQEFAAGLSTSRTVGTGEKLSEDRLKQIEDTEKLRASIETAFKAFNDKDFAKVSTELEKILRLFVLIEENAKRNEPLIKNPFSSLRTTESGKFILGEEGDPSLNIPSETAPVLVDRLKAQFEEFQKIQLELQATQQIVTETNIIHDQTKEAARQLNAEYNLSNEILQEEKQNIQDIAAELIKVKQTMTELNKLQQTPVPPLAPSSGAAPGGGGFFAFGGKASYMASGGFPGGPRGSDVRPVWARSGEFFMNPYASKVYAPILRAMNSRQGPSNVGGSTSFGDINVTVNGGDSSQATVSQIIRGLRREMRKGTFKV